MIARQISFFATAAVMSAWATVMLHTIATGHINRLLSPMFRNYVLTASVLLFILSVLYLVLYQSDSTTAPAFAPTGRVRQLGRWLVLLIPVIAASVLSPTALSSTTAATRGLNSTAGVTAMPTMSATTAKNVALELSCRCEPTRAAVESEPSTSSPLSHAPAEMNKLRVAAKAGPHRRFRHRPRAQGLAQIAPLDDVVLRGRRPAHLGQNLGGPIPGTGTDTQWVEIVGISALSLHARPRAVPRIDASNRPRQRTGTGRAVSFAQEKSMSLKARLCFSLAFVIFIGVPLLLSAPIIFFDSICDRNHTRISRGKPCFMPTR